MIDPDCAALEAAWDEKGIEVPPGYDEQRQQDFLANYFALGVTQSPVHGAMPHAAGRAAIGFDLLVLPPLSCDRRFALGHTKTEENSPSPVVPRPRFTGAVAGPGRSVLYGGFAWLPPVGIAGTRSVLMSGELGAGVPLGETGLEAGMRFHASLFKSVGDVASAVTEDAPVVKDVFIASSFGADLLVSTALGGVHPFAAVGVTDVSTFFYVGDDGFAAENQHPYLGPVASLGAEVLVADRVRLGGELYAAIGGSYGHLYTGRVRVGWELGRALPGGRSHESGPP